MVNSNVIRGGGLIILAGCYVAVERAFTNNVVNDATNLHVDLVGADRGSMYNVSFVASKLMPRCHLLSFSSPHPQSRSLFFLSFSNNN